MDNTHQEHGGGREVSISNVANAARGTPRSGSPSSSSEGVSLPMSLIKALRGKSSGDTGSQSSNGGSDHNSDNSALISLGNTSFGFNFDREEGNNSPLNSSSDGDSDGNNASNYQKKPRGPKGNMEAQQARVATSQRAESNPKPTAATSSGNQGPASMVIASTAASHNDAAAEAVANLQSIASAWNKGSKNGESTLVESYRNAFFGQGGTNDEVDSCSDTEASTNKQSLKRKTLHNADNDSDNDNLSIGESDMDSHRGGRKKKKVDEFKREERNAREKERSFRISRQITELRGLLSSGGVIVPKGTKSSVLTEAANYIRMLQQHQYRSEM
jgi:hypothetical protein